MRSISQRAEVGLIYLCVFFALVTAALGVVGILGVRSTTAVSDRIVSDELTTETATATTSRAMDAIYSSGEQILLSSDPAARSRLGVLYSQSIPAADASLATLVRLHADDDQAELVGISQLDSQWASIRSVLDPGVIAGLSGPSPELADKLTADYTPLSNHLDDLLSREQDDADRGRALAQATDDRTVWITALSVALAEVVTFAAYVIGRRQIRRSAEPEADQVEFAETLQLAKNEEEAHALLQRHLERIIPDANATVLNRNNSADRLEAVTALPPGSPLVRSLQHAEPQACLAVRSARRNDQGGEHPRLLTCTVCGDCAGTSTCTPLTVSGEVIGSVLVNRPTACTASDKQRISNSVSQAAPVLANLRNLAIAEVRAATDSLTGLPNKRVVGDTLKRMVAQAARTLTPVALILIDLDHFKNINDRLGHPVGDQTLASVGEVLRSALRASDFAGRNGGEEFAVVLPDTDVTGAALIAEKIRQGISDITLPSSDTVVTASLGVAVYPDHAATTERLERLADAALYTAKRSGRNRVEIAIISEERSAIVGVTE
ncbi:MAG TPA: GGDEF domain-containing protein [Acidothermaceae bacterium]